MRKTTAATLISVILLFITNTSLAQLEQVPSAQQPVYFCYAEATRVDGKLKVLFISSELIRVTDASLPSIDVDLRLDFDALVKDIPRDDSPYPNSSSNIGLRSIGATSIYGDYLRWNPNWPNYENVNRNDNTLSAMEKIRKSFIEEYKSKGYLVYQIKIRPRVTPENKGGYVYYDAKKLQYIPYKMETLSPLSPLWIPVYQNGMIRKKLEEIGEGSGNYGGSVGLVIEDKSDNKNSNNDRSNNNSGSKGSSSETEEKSMDYWLAVAAQKRIEAEGYEAEGDKLYKLGTLFYLQALEQYKKAQLANPTSRVQQKIDEINAYVVLGQSINAGLEGLERGSEKVRQNMDAAGLPRFRAGFFSYHGIPTGPSKANDPAPWSTSITYGFYRIFALEAGMFYGQSPVFDLYLTDKNGEKVNQVIRANRTNGGFTLSAGLAVPARAFLLYGMYGWNIPLFTTSSTLYSDGYDFPDAKDYFNTMKAEARGRLGFVYKIPRSRIAIGAHYLFNTLKGEKIVDDNDSPYNQVTAGSQKYYVGGTLKGEYRFNQVGIDFCIRGKK